ncbi:MAG TPA: universal stress protein [Chitinophagaceae bacterium]|nr:universal stress protein [Chitinophagaceae bacterium]
MKNILVLTDFSENAKAAELYALQLATIFRAHFMLYNAYPIYTVPVSDTVIWPHDQTVSLEYQSLSNLQYRVDELKSHLKNLPAGAYKPAIDHLNNAGNVENQLNEVIKENNIWLVIMGTKGESLSSNVLFGSNVFRVLATAGVPVLIIPSKSVCENLKHIVYATDFRNTDVSIIKWLKDFSRQIKAELSVIHVSGDTSSNMVENDKSLAEAISGSAGDAVQIKYFHQKSISESLLQMEKEMNIDMLAMMHRKHGFFDNLFHGSTTHKVIRHTEIPILVFPG